MLVKPETIYSINTNLPLVSLEVPENIFFDFVHRIEKQYVCSVRKYHYDENGIFHYITCYDVQNLYGESLGTACVIHEVNA